MMSLISIATIKMTKKMENKSINMLSYFILLCQDRK